MRHHASLSPEQALLLACARSTLRPDHVAQIQHALGKGIDWNQFWPLVRAHGVGYFVGNHLKCQILNSKFEIRNSKFEENEPRIKHRLNTDSNPISIRVPSVACNEDFGFPISDIQVRIQQDLWQETAHALVLREQQLRLNAELARACLPALWLKGLVLADRLYGRFEARHCGDLDLLVDPADVSRAEELLARLGFERFRPAEAGKEYHPLAAHHSLWCARVLPDWLLIVELHHRLSGPCRCQPAAAELLRRSQVIEFHGQEMRVPSLEDELLILCLHAHHHNFALLRCLMDVAEFVRRFHDEVDWSRLIQRARESRCFGRLRGTLEITDAVLGLEDHARVLEQMPSLTSRQRWAINTSPIAMLLDPRTQQHDFIQARFALLMDSWSDAIRLLAPRLFPSQDHVRDICPPFCRRAPGLPHAYYYLHSAGQMLKTSSKKNG